MNNKKFSREEKGGNTPWMNTFADLMNLLLCFFVLLFAMSDVNSEKFESAAASLAQNGVNILPGDTTAIGEGTLIASGVSQLNELDEYVNSMGTETADTIQTAETSETDGEAESAGETETVGDTKSAGGTETAGGTESADGTETAENANNMAIDQQTLLNQLGMEQMKESEKMAEDVQSTIATDQLDSYIDLNFTNHYVSLTLSGALLFESGSSELKKDSYPILEKIGVILQKYNKSTIEIEGHTDSVPIHNSKFKNNNELSSFRALAVFDYFVEESHLDPATLKHSGRGEYIPIADNATVEGRAKNRRVEIKIYNTLGLY